MCAGRQLGTDVRATMPHARGAALRATRTRPTLPMYRSGPEDTCRVSSVGAEVRLPDAVVAEQRLAGVGEHDLPDLENVPAVS